MKAAKLKAAKLSAAANKASKAAHAALDAAEATEAAVSEIVSAAFDMRTYADFASRGGVGGAAAIRRRLNPTAFTASAKKLLPLLAAADKAFAALIEAQTHMEVPSK